MQIEYDPGKNELNRAKHGLALAEAARLGWERAVFLPDERFKYGEPRSRVYAMLDGRLHMAAITMRGAMVRVISLRRASVSEVRRYGNAAR